MRRLLMLLALVSACALVADAHQRIPGYRIVKPQPAGAWTECSGCVFTTSFTNAQGWNSDYTQIGTGCGSGWDTVQTGFEDHGGWSDGGACDEIKASSNHAAGAGGRGYAYKIANGTNQVSGGFEINLTAIGVTQSYYYRFYMRMQDGLSITGNTSPWKMIYHVPASGDCTGGCYMGLGTTETRITQNGANTTGALGGANNVDLRDDLWHCVEIHLDKSGSGATDVVQVKIDGTFYLNETTFTFNNASDFTMFALENGAFTATGTMVMSIDELAVKLTDWVGCPVGPS